MNYELLSPAIVAGRLLAVASTLPSRQIGHIIEGLIDMLDARAPDAEAEPDDDGEPDADGYVLTLLRDPHYAESLRNEACTGWPDRYHGEDMEPEEEGCCEAGEDRGTMDGHPLEYCWRQDVRNAGAGAARRVRDFVYHRGRNEHTGLAPRRKERWA